MSKLIYIANVSLDGYIEDSHGNFDWTAPNDEVFAFITDLLRSAAIEIGARGAQEGGDEREDLVVGRGPIEIAVRVFDVPVKRDVRDVDQRSEERRVGTE